MAGERNRSVDICKGILTVTMILGHCIQFFGFEEEGLQKILVNVINLTTFSGFLFCFGFVGNLAYYENRTFRRSAWKLAKNAARLLIAFYVSGIAYMAFVEDKIFRWDFITEILLLKRYPGWSEFLASFAAMMAAGILLYPLMKRMNGWILAGIAVVSGAACFLPYGEIHNSWLALLAVPGILPPFPFCSIWYISPRAYGFPENGCGGNHRFWRWYWQSACPVSFSLSRKGIFPTVSRPPSSTLPEAVCSSIWTI